MYSDVEADKKGAWSPEEDERLKRVVKALGARNWSAVADRIPGRTGKSCRLRWCNHLSPEVRKEPFTPWEDAVLILAHESKGNKWSVISQMLPGRTDNAVKNRWNSTLKRKYTSGSLENRYLADGVTLHTLLNELQHMRTVTSDSSSGSESPAPGDEETELDDAEYMYRGNAAARNISSQHASSLKRPPQQLPSVAALLREADPQLFGYEAFHGDSEYALNNVNSWESSAFAGPLDSWNAITTLQMNDIFGADLLTQLPSKRMRLDLSATPRDEQLLLGSGLGSYNHNMRQWPGIKVEASRSSPQPWNNSHSNWPTPQAYGPPRKPVLAATALAGLGQQIPVHQTVRSLQRQDTVNSSNSNTAMLGDLLQQLKQQQ